MDRSLCASIQHRAVLHLLRAAHGIDLTARDIADIEAAPAGELVSISSQQGIAPLMADGLDYLGPAQPDIDRDLRIFFREIRQGNRQRNEKMAAQLIEAAMVLGEGDIPVVVLKGGCELAMPSYGKLHKRFIGDLDLLVPDASLQDAYDALEAVDYFNAYESDEFYDSPDHHDAPLVAERWPAAVELHHTIGGKEGSRFLPARQIFGNAVTTEIDNVKVPSLHDRLVHLVFHQQTQHSGYDDRLVSLRTIADVAALVVDADHIQAARRPFVAAGIEGQFDGLLSLVEIVLPGIFPLAESTPGAENWATQSINRFGNPRDTTREFQTRRVKQWASDVASNPERRSELFAKMFSSGGLQRILKNLRSLKQR